MGQAEFFPKWYEYLSKTNSSHVQVTFLYGSYDHPVSDNETQRCQEARLALDFVDCQVRFIPHTTWTQGRNLLALDAILLEKKQGRHFDVWTFADDDAHLHCPHDDDDDDKDNAPRQCWQRFVEILGQARELPSKITTITPAYKEAVSGWLGVSTQDAIVTAFRRDFVPFCLPYAVPPPGLSEWLSQAALFYIMRNCFPSSVVSPPRFYTENPVHRKYSRKDFNNQTVMQTIRENYGKFVNFELFCNVSCGEQGEDRVGPFESVQELVANIASHNQDLCAPLIRRFDEWVQVMTEVF